MSIDFEKYLSFVWQGNTVYNESVMPLFEENGELLPISLAYEIDKIIEVRSSSLETVYQEGRDYIVEDGRLVILKDGQIPVMRYDEYYPMETANTMARTNGGRILFFEGGFFHTKQIAVTYSHNGKWDAPSQQYQGELLPKTIEKLKNKKPLKIAFFGDSIFTGCNASGSQFGGNVPPFMPAWFDMLVVGLKKHYGYEEITYVNRSLGGRKSYWGVENAQERVADYHPDLTFIGFGMNDKQTPNEDYYNNISEIMNKVKKTNPECEFVLTAPMVANKEAEGFYCHQNTFVHELNKLKGNGVGVMDVTTAHEYLLTRKSYRDMTGNNVNHPNDFLCRIYAQTALACLVE